MRILIPFVLLVLLLAAACSGNQGQAVPGTGSNGSAAATQPAGNNQASGGTNGGSTAGSNDAAGGNTANSSSGQSGSGTTTDNSQASGNTSSGGTSGQTVQSTQSTGNNQASGSDQSGQTVQSTQAAGNNQASGSDQSGTSGQTVQSTQAAGNNQASGSDQSGSQTTQGTQAAGNNQASGNGQATGTTGALVDNSNAQGAGQNAGQIANTGPTNAAQQPVIGLAENLPADLNATLTNYLVRTLNVPAERVALVSAVQSTFPNACLGLAQEGENCAQSQTSGWLVIGSVNGSYYFLRASDNGSAIRLESSVDNAGLSNFGHNLPADLGVPKNSGG